METLKTNYDNGYKRIQNQLSKLNSLFDNSLGIKKVLDDVQTAYILKEYFPERQVEFAADLQYALHFEGRDLCDNESYRPLLEKYNFDEKDFFDRLGSEDYKEKAYYEFALCKQLQVNGFPTVFIQTAELKFNMVARGFTPYKDLRERIENILAEIIS